MRSAEHRSRLITTAAILAMAGFHALSFGDPARAAQPAPTAPAAASPSGPDNAPLTSEELEQLLAPIALYPDSLVSQVLMASTYPLEIVEADRWITRSKDLKGAALAKALEAQPWDPSVKSLTNFPQLLSMMSDKLAQTVKLGDAFLDQQEQVMATIQSLRARAKQNGNLQTTPQQTVATDQQGSTQIITIESADPEVIYVPAYDPAVVYGVWPYPAYPPYYYYPPGYSAGAVALSFGVGVACGVAWGYAWGHCDWHHGDVDVDINRNNNFNRDIDRSKYRNNFNGGASGRGKWQHNPSHRQGVAYRNDAATQRYGGPRSTQAVRSREAYRGRADAARADLARDAANMPGRTGAAGDRRPAGAGDRSTSGNRPQPSRGGASAFDGVNRGGQAARQSSNRGNYSRGVPARSSPARGGGGGGRRGGRR